MRAGFAVTTALCVLCLAMPVAATDFTNVYGASPKAMAMGNAFTAVADNFSAVIYNPAGLAQIDDHELIVGHFLGIPSLGERGGSMHSAGAFEATVSAPMMGFSLNLSRILEKYKRRLVIGMIMGIPHEFKGFSYMKAVPPREPTFPLIGRASDVMVLTWGVGIQAHKRIFVGAGVRFNMRFGFNIIDIDLNLLTGDVVYNRVEIDPITEVAAVAGALIRPIDRLRLGLVWREGTYSTDVTGNFIANIQLGGLVVPTNIRIGFFDFYLPEELAVGCAYQLNEDWLIALDCTFARWSSYKDSFGHRVGKDLFNDIIFPSVGFQYRAARGEEHGMFTNWEFFLRGGYTYKPTPVEKVQSDTSYLDANKHVFGAGFGLEFELERFFYRPVMLEGAFQWQQLQTREQDVFVGHVEVSGYQLGGCLTFTTRF